VEFLDEEIGADAAKKSAYEAEEGKGGDVHELALLNESGCCAVVPMAPEGFGIVANVVYRHKAYPGQKTHQAK